MCYGYTERKSVYKGLVPPGALGHLLKYKTCHLPHISPDKYWEAYFITFAGQKIKRL